MVSKDPQTVALLEISESLKQKYAQQAQQCQLNFLLKALALISKTDVNYKSAKNQRLLVEMALMQLTFLTASPDAEKKNDESEVVTISENPTSPGNTAIQKAPVTQEPEIKFAKKPTVSFDELKKVKTGFSLNEARNGQNGKEMNGVTEEKTVVVHQNKEVGFEDVKTAIHTYAETKQQNGARQLATTLKTSVISFADGIITLTINNETQREQLQNIRQDFLDEIRKKLQNNTIGLQVDISKQEVQSKAYKPADIFKVMIDKNPSLLELKKRFDLEIDY
jgi:DNA polymerase-3 subunit gamma/tau